ncbi:MAG: alpha/beta hydrolase [Candidatus Omnitrophica bacterium]|nr:alpha/beta hydrolase [Candidatus Omnitrophota bacterium]
MILKVIVTIIVVYVLYALVLFTFQRSLIFPGVLFPPEKIQHDDVETVWLETSCGKVEAWYMHAKNVTNSKKVPVVIHTHGNGELIDHWPDMLLPYTDFGVSVLLVEYPGYGRSEGFPSERTVTEACVRAYDWLLNRKDIDAEVIIGHGRSIGGGAICALARQRKLRAMILESTFTSVKQFAKQYLMPTFLVRDPFDNLSVVKSYNGPILFFHGKYDTIVPYQNSVILSQHAQNAQFITWECNHNDSPPDWDAYWQTIRTFLRENKII